MKWLIASDLHGSAYYGGMLLDAVKREGASRLLLLGDILYHGPRNDLPEGYSPKALAALLNASPVPVYAVRGNCDAAIDQCVLSFPLMADYMLLEAGEHVLFLTHGDNWNAENLPPLKEGDALIHGHTHVPLNITKNGVRVLNPGSVSIPKEGSSRGYIVLEDGLLTRKTLGGETEFTVSLA